MIEVLEDKTKKEIECTKCHSVLGYNLYLDPQKHYDSDGEKLEDYIICPLCAERIVLNEIPVATKYNVERGFSQYKNENVEDVLIECPHCHKIDREPLYALDGDDFALIECNHCKKIFAIWSLYSAIYI